MKQLSLLVSILLLLTPESASALKTRILSSHQQAVNGIFSKLEAEEKEEQAYDKEISEARKRKK